MDVWVATFIKKSAPPPSKTARSKAAKSEDEFDAPPIQNCVSKNPKSENLKSICDEFPKGGLKTLAIQLGEELPNRAGRRIIANAIIKNINTKCTECKNTLVTV